ncbi:MAG: hypothetical protein DMG07_19030, partial [Acidobacteria bacterium]
ESAFLARIAQELGLREEHVAGASLLLESGATIPFIARYRKEATGGMDERRLRDLRERRGYYADLAARRAAVLKAIEEQGKLTSELREKIEASVARVELDDLYLPFRPKKKSLGAEAAGRGLEPLAEYLWSQEADAWSLEEHADVFIDPEKGVPTREAALEGAAHIIAEWIAQACEARRLLREHLWREGALVSKVVSGKAEEKTKYAMYYDRREPLAKIPSHRILAIRRGTKEGILNSSIACDDARGLELVAAFVIRDREAPFAPILEAALRDGYFRLLRPSIEAEIRAQVKEQADREAIRVFQVNLANLLLSPAAGTIPVLGVNPRKGGEARLAVVDETGRFVAGSAATINPAEPEPASTALAAALGLVPVRAVAISSGAGAHEVEGFVRAYLDQAKIENVFVAAVSDAGLAAYVASPAAREELPDLEPALRGAISVARRLQDPLSELVKVEPRAIGVGQYQHDVNQFALSRALNETLVSCVSHVGVDCNRAPASLLRHVAGLGERRAAAIVAHREANGPFRSRAALGAVPEMTEAAYQQAAGFLRVRDAEDPLDRTAIHPEQLPTVERMAAMAGVPIYELLGNRSVLANLNLEELVTECVGRATLRDLRDELANPGHDPRRPFVVPKFRPDLREVADLKEGMTLEGAVTNVTNFGAFVDIGVRQDGLVHLSQMSNRYIRDPREAVKVGDVVSVKVLAVDAESKRISLSMKALLPPLPRRRKKHRPAAAPDGGPPPAVPSDGREPEREPRRSAPPGRRDGRRRRPRRQFSGPPRAPEPEAAQAVEPQPEPRPEAPPVPEPTLREKIASLQSKFRGIS